MTQLDDEGDAVEPQVTDVPEPDQEPHEPIPDEVADEEEREPQPPDEVPDEQQATQEEWEARFTYAERVFKTYRKKIEERWAEDAIHLIPFNLDSGAPPGYVDGRNAGRVDEETKAAALSFIGQPNASEVPDDPYSHVCETCKGWGVVQTHSLVPTQEVRNCLDCRGIGWVPMENAGLTLDSPARPDPHESNGVVVPMQTGPESPELEALRLRGYTIIPPMQTNA